MKHAMLIATVALACALSTASVRAQKEPADLQSPRSPSVQAFVKAVAQGGMAEVELGKLAESRAASVQVKDFAKRMVEDHSKANDELKSLASQKNISLPTDLNAKDKALESRLQTLSGESFDRAYMNAMIREHRKDIAEFRREAQSGNDPDVEVFAANTLPTLKEHLRLAESTGQAVGTSGTKPARKTNARSK